MMHSAVDYDALADVTQISEYVKGVGAVEDTFDRYTTGLFGEGSSGYAEKIKAVYSVSLIRIVVQYLIL